MQVSVNVHCSLEVRNSFFPGLTLAVISLGVVVVVSTAVSAIVDVTIFRDRKGE